MSRGAMDRSGHMLEQRYRLGHMLGQGGMAAVYLAEDTKLGKAVAVKVLNPEYAIQPKVVQRFIQEARSITRVRHPNVIDVTDYGVTPDRSVFLVMELLHGEDLSATLERDGPLPWSRLAPIVLQICAALVVVHQGGIVHRDIKPSNCFRIRVTGNPDFIKVLDFGIAKVLEGPAAPGAPQSTTGSLLGTPEYMAPELPRGLRPDARVDIYALGVLMYKMLTGSAPFTAEVYMAVLAKHMFDPVEPPRQRAPQLEIPEAVEAVIMRALAKERDDRYPSMAAFAEAIVATLPDQPSAARWLDGSREVPVADPQANADARGDTVLAPVRRPPERAPDEANQGLDPSATLARRRVRRGLPALTLSLAAVALGVVVFTALRTCGAAPGAAPGREAAPVHEAAPVGR
jgi:serine/threonine protein kinase